MPAIVLIVIQAIQNLGARLGEVAHQAQMVAEAQHEGTVLWPKDILKEHFQVVLVLLGEMILAAASIHDQSQGERHIGASREESNLLSNRVFKNLEIVLGQGRVWSADENSRGDFIAVVKRAFATRYLSSSNALDRQLRIPGLTAHKLCQAVSAQSTAWRQIVGVVGDARNDGVDHPVVPAIYIPYTAAMQAWAQFLVRTQGDPLTSMQSIRAAIASIAPDQQISNKVSSFNGTFTLIEAIERDAQYSRQRLFSISSGVFSAMALGLALVGIFSVVAYSVAQRTTEFGVRLALGASRTHVLWIAAPLLRAVCSQPPDSSLSAHSSPACGPPATPSPSHPPKLSGMNKAYPI
jgi:hypothetical protein